MPQDESSGFSSLSHCDFLPPAHHDVSTWMSYRLLKYIVRGKLIIFPSQKKKRKKEKPIPLPPYYLITVLLQSPTLETLESLLNMPSFLLLYLLGNSGFSFLKYPSELFCLVHCYWFCSASGLCHLSAGCANIQQFDSFNKSSLGLPWQSSG